MYKHEALANYMDTMFCPRVRVVLAGKPPAPHSGQQWPQMSAFDNCGIVDAGFLLREMSIHPLPDGGGIVFAEANAFGITLRFARDARHLGLSLPMMIASNLFSPAQLVKSLGAINKKKVHDVYTGTSPLFVPFGYAPQIKEVRIPKDHPEMMEIDLNISSWINLPIFPDQQLYGGIDHTIRINRKIVEVLA